MKKIYHLFVIVLTIFPFGRGNLKAQSLTFSGEIRPRFEFRHGYKTIIPDGNSAASFISQRTRLNLFYGSQKFKFGIALQNVRVWGDVPQLNSSDVYGTALHQAWGEVIFSKKLAFKIGRQEISYDDQRIFGGVNWTQQARSHDAAILKYRPNKMTKIDVGLAQNAQSETLYKIDYLVNNYKTFQYIWYHRRFNKSGLSLLFLNNGMPYHESNNSQAVVYSQTYGGRFTYTYNPLNFNASFYYQGGKNKLDNTLSAEYAAAEVTYSLPCEFTFGLGGEYLSGTSSKEQALNQTDNSFKPFYGTNHKFNGWMDYFYVGNYMYSNGLMDISLPLTQKANRFTFKLVPHYFLAAAKVSASQGNGTWKDYKSNLGAEIDFSANYNFSNDVSISGGYSQMMATQTLQVLKGGNHKNSNNWAWLMLTFKPTFFSKL
ncbi:alginate export family protein [Prolixibacter denitrificans]|uniref:Alginate export protein n=1 Tax=Prolixibacter denitrificans TaxID=1541063 RepID=A0A2P8CCT2_9BACT|nr:alginate export family protein [Prolixibacter denitrificans]PSK82783.1 alginate export protein [Prolixibacter denitrificans]GET21401.1 hypothetical protein JCM18694_16470 [Prolixibacter denitrificans]